MMEAMCAAGAISPRQLAGELNRRGVPAAGGGLWHANTVRWLITKA
jgi:hypothetical protein